MGRLTLLLAAFVLLASPARAVGFREILVPDPGDAPIEVGIWYPSDAVPAAVPLGLETQRVATDGAIAGHDLPLIVMSHGTGGSFASHYDTAIALAEAGFVAAALTHTGDNFGDQSRAAHIIDRPRQLHVVLSYLLTDWPEREKLDPARVGVFGFSAGGFTALVAAGGTPDFSAIAPHCAAYPQEWTCRMLAERHVDLATIAVPPASAWVHDDRIKAAVIAAPALGYTFGKQGLAGVHVPVQLWGAADDEVLPLAWHAGAVDQALPTPPNYTVVANAGHFSFLAPCGPAFAERVPAICRDAPGFDRAAFHRQFNAAVVAFFKAKLAD